MKVGTIDMVLVRRLDRWGMVVCFGWLGRTHAHQKLTLHRQTAHAPPRDLGRSSVCARDTNSQERGEGKALMASRSKAVTNSGRKRMKAMTSGRMPVLMAHSHHSCTPPRSRCERTGSAKVWASAS